MSLRESKKKKKKGLGRENRIILIAIIAAIIFSILWFLYGYHYIVVPSAELSFMAP